MPVDLPFRDAILKALLHIASIDWAQQKLAQQSHCSNFKDGN